MKPTPAKSAPREKKEPGKHGKVRPPKADFATQGLGFGVWKLDLASGEMRGSGQWGAIHGRPPSTGMSFDDWVTLVHADDQAKALRELDRTLQNGSLYQCDLRVAGPDGSWRWLNMRGEVVRDAGGKPAGLRGICIDIHERVVAEHERRVLLSRLAEAQRQETQRIARELHDDLIQQLAALAIDIGVHIRNPPGISPPVQEDLRQFQERVIRISETARHAVYRLHPSEVDDLGLEAALRAHCEDFGRQEGLAVRFVSGGLPRIKLAIAHCLYHVAQESLRNTARHARVHQADVTLGTAGGRIRLRVEDQGEGFAVSSIQSAAGLGIIGMRERVELLDGSFSIDSQPGKGTQVTAEIPLGGES